MSASSDADRYRREIQDLQGKIAAASSKVAGSRAKAHKAQSDASRASSVSSIQSKLREAERYEKEAISAEKLRADLESKVARRQKDLFGADAKVHKERAAATDRTLRELGERTKRAEQQFRPASVGYRPGLPVGPLPVLEAERPDRESDVFLSHASEDKDEVARPLKECLEHRGVRVWFDESALSIGDSLRRSIDRGLARSRYGLVVLSPDFFRKSWPQSELDGLFARQTATNEKVILPVWHRITKDDVLRASPLLADLLAFNTAVMTLEEIADGVSSIVRV
jgi:hypothetical protein